MSTPTLLRSRVEGLTRLAKRDLYDLWQQVETLAAARVALNDVLPALIQTYGEAAAVVAAEWYDELRGKVDAPRFRAIPAGVPDPGVVGLVAWSEKTATTLDTMLPLVVGGVQKRIANAARDSVIGSVSADPSAVGWKRVGPGACPFCRMLIERDQLYRAETADFASHDNCLCQAYPLIRGAEPIDVKDYLVSDRRTIDPETGKPIKDANYERAREWMSANGLT